MNTLPGIQLVSMKLYEILESKEKYSICDRVRGNRAFVEKNNFKVSYEL